MNILGWIPFLFVILPPQDVPSDLLTRYLSIRTEHPQASTAEAAKFWVKEAEKEGIANTTFSLDPNERCINFIAYLPATVTEALDPILLLHHSDVVEANGSEWKFQPYSPTWTEENGEPRLYGRGAIDDKGQGVLHWNALLQLKSSSEKRSRDVFFVMNCGEETGDAFGAAAFVNFLIRPLPDSYFLKASNGYELSSVNKLEVARILEKFPRLSKIGFVWNEGSFGSTTELAPYTLVPVANAQKGLWVGRVVVRGPSGHGSLSSSLTALEVLVRGIGDLYDQNTSWRNWFRSLHSEQAQMASAVASTRPFWQKIILKFYPRLFFELMGLQTLVTSWWQANLHTSNSSMPNVVASEASSLLEYRFLGEKTQAEIEALAIRSFKKFSRPPLSIEIQTHSYSPFRRSFFEDREADIFRSVLEAYPQTVVTPFITPGITDSRFFRMVGIKSFDLVPFFLSRDEIRSMHGLNESLRHSEFKRGLTIEANILKKLVN